MYGMERVISSGCASRCALYSAYSTSRLVVAAVSKHTAMCDGFCLVKISNKVLVKPWMADVFIPLELYKGFLLNAK